MTRDDIVKMAREAGGSFEDLPTCDAWLFYKDEHLERFAALVAAEKEAQMIRDGWRKCAEGQRTTQFCGLLEEAVKAEREACADICKSKRESLEKAGGRFEAIVAGICEQRIRSRGET